MADFSTAKHPRRECHFDKKWIGEFLGDSSKF